MQIYIFKSETRKGGTPSPVCRLLEFVEAPDDPVC